MTCLPIQALRYFLSGHFPCRVKNAGNLYFKTISLIQKSLAILQDKGCIKISNKYESSRRYSAKRIKCPNSKNLRVFQPQNLISYQSLSSHCLLLTEKPKSLPHIYNISKCKNSPPKCSNTK